MNTSMKTTKTTKKKASARKAPKTSVTANLDYVNQIADEAIATIMAMRAVITTLADEKEARK